MNFKKLGLIFTLLFLFIFPLQVNASTTVNTFQITNDGSQQKDAMIYGNLVAYTNFGGTQGIDIWGYDLTTKQNFPLLEKPGDQFLTGFYEDLLVYEDVDSSQNYDVRIYNLKTHDDKLIAGGTGAQTSGVTNGNVVAYINGGACGELHLFNLESQVNNVIFNNTCHPVRISENNIVFPSPDPNGTNVKGYNLESGQLFDISTANNFQESANIYKDKVVWVHYTTGALGDYNAIILKDLTSGQEKTIYESTTSTLQNPSISGQYIVWSESSAQHVNGIKGYNIETGEVFEVQPQGPHQNSHTGTSIFGNTAVWMSFRTGNGDVYGSTFQTVIPQPTVTLTNPTNNSQVLVGSEVDLQATASSSVGVNRVVFHVNGVHQCTDYFAPYSCAWDVPPTPGAAYQLTAWVIDNNGQKNSSSVNVPSTSPILVGAALGNYKPPLEDDCDIKVPFQFSSIQAAINSASIGDSVCVNAGTYTEDLLINKSITLSGQGVSNTSINGQISGNGGTVRIAADNVVLEGFKINGIGTDYTSGTLRVEESVSNVKIQYNHIKAGNGELALLTDGYQNNHLIENNILEGNNSPQVAFVNGTPATSKASNKVDFINNTFTGTVNPTSRSDTGVVLIEHATDSLIKQNVFNTSGIVNEVIQNAYASSVGGVNYNNINSVAQLWKVSNSVGVLNAENNWWGDTDPSSDVRNNMVDFTPFETIPFTEN